MRPLVEKHIEEALLKPWPVSEPECPAVPEALQEVWSVEKRATCFFLGTVLPLLCLMYPIIIAGPRSWWQVIDMSSRASGWAALVLICMISSVLPVLLSSACMVAFCLQPKRRDNVWVRRGLLLGCATWGLMFIVLIGPTFLLISIPSVVVVGIVSLITNLGAKVFCSRYRFSIASILHLTFWCALAVVVLRIIPWDYWDTVAFIHLTLFLLVSATPGAAWYAFWTTTNDLITGKT